jgi:hypothetical protein
MTKKDGLLREPSGRKSFEESALSKLKIRKTEKMGRERKA